MNFDVQSTASGAPRPARVRSLLSRLSRVAPASGGARANEVSILFCGDGRMRRLNREWRGKDRETDVLAFPAPASFGSGSLLGDIVISVPYALRQARRRGEPPSREIDRLLVHGFLHLLGYDHETDDGEMDSLEARLRGRLGIADRA